MVQSNNTPVCYPYFTHRPERGVIEGSQLAAAKLPSFLLTCAHVTEVTDAVWIFRLAAQH